MNDLKPPVIPHPWKIIVRNFDPRLVEAYESIFSIGNGYMGQRANFEEDYSGPSLQGTYIGGIFYPDKTRVGWWKIGYPEYFARVPNSPFWAGIRFRIDGELLDLHRMQVEQFEMELDMQSDILMRRFRASFPSGKTVEVESRRFISMARKELAAIQYRIRPLNFSGTFEWTSYIDGDVKNREANYGEYFWDITEVNAHANGEACLMSKTRKTGYTVCTHIAHRFDINGQPVPFDGRPVTDERFAGYVHRRPLDPGQSLSIYKRVAVTHSLHFPPDRLREEAEKILAQIAGLSFDDLAGEHRQAWEKIWESADIEIKGDVKAQQGIRYNILQLNHTYTGEDPRLNIGPKGFTGEKYGGGTYWDTEAYCLPFYLGTKSPKVGKNLLLYRYRHLPRAIENARKLGFENGAALYPMVTVNGEECHNEWEITFEEIHRNGAIVYAIYNYVQYTGDEEYIPQYGLEVMIAIARFWARRFQFSQPKGRYVMLGVTGPNEYENNVNNNWYTSYLARWNLQYTLENIRTVREKYPDDWERIVRETGLRPEEWTHWQELIDLIYFPYDEERRIYLQQDDFLDKEIRPARLLPDDQRPLNQYWSWDRILRSCYIKQADVLQGMYFFEHHFDRDTLARHFDFYEPLTVHESSLSPCVHSILASALERDRKAYELYLRTARLDLDDYNREVNEGLHITSMAGTWLSVVQGFGGMRTLHGKLEFRPRIPEQWEEYAFKITYRGSILQVRINRQSVEIRNLSGQRLELEVYGKPYRLEPYSRQIIRHVACV